MASSGTCGVGCIGDAVFHCQAAVAVPVMAYFAVAAAAKWLCRLLCGEICLRVALAFEVVATTFVTPPEQSAFSSFVGLWWEAVAKAPAKMNIADGKVV